MENTGLSSRRPAKIVGYVDLVLIALQIGILVVGLSLICYHISDSSHTAQNDQVVKVYEIMKSNMHGILIYMLLVVVAIFGVRIWAAVMLIHSTKPGTPVFTAWKRASCWKWTTIVFLALRLIGTLRHYESGCYWIVFVLCTAIDAIFLYFVLGYVKELNRLVPTTHQNFTNEKAHPKSSPEGNAQTEFPPPYAVHYYGQKV